MTKNGQKKVILNGKIEKSSKNSKKSLKMTKNVKKQ